MAISVDNLNVQLQSRSILSGIRFQAAQSQTVGLLGPNGSGKSTLMRALAGLTPATGSIIRISGELLSQLPRKKLARKLAFVPQHAEAEAELNVRDIIALGRTPHRGMFDVWTAEDSAAVNDGIAFMQLENLLDRQWHRLSGGERQRCQIARALAQKPDVLLLDEPVNHLDIQFQLELMRLITALPITVVIALHDLNLAAKYCQHLVILKEGKVIATGAPNTVLTPELIHNTWRVKAHINPTSTGTLNIQYA
ncbi:ABC transporter ATP-binding protein [Type-D symbiont of Plautia stali]|uniref:ABC transporter ATP-binding protein n=1 Tax=Type-D symbiont of Plautia stali TaxID=1560356 RepID=UPI00073EA5CF|nr:ABC transporter ATP-binding protein [Type-D symbiont of Plautia stali]